MAGSKKKNVQVDIVTSDDIKIYYTGKFQDFTTRYIINMYINAQTVKQFKISWPKWGYT